MIGSKQYCPFYQIYMYIAGHKWPAIHTWPHTLTSPRSVWAQGILVSGWTMVNFTSDKICVETDISVYYMIEVPQLSQHCKYKQVAYNYTALCLQIFTVHIIIIVCPTFPHSTRQTLWGAPLSSSPSVNSQSTLVNIYTGWLRMLGTWTQ